MDSLDVVSSSKSLTSDAGGARVARLVGSIELLETI